MMPGMKEWMADADADGQEDEFEADDWLTQNLQHS
jgi:hypothetical protein